MYWSNDTYFHQESVSSVMLQTRFLQIWQYFYLADNSRAVPRGSPGFDKISWKKLFYYGLEVCLLNSFIIFKRVKPGADEFLSYRSAIVRHLLEGTCFCGRHGRVLTRPLADVNARRPNMQYHFIAIEEKRRDCVVCAKIVSVQDLSKNSRNKTNIVCVTCDRKPLRLHSKRNCWEKWHSLVEY